MQTENQHELPEAAADAGATTAQLYRLDLDADGIYWGAVEIHADDVKPGDVVLDHRPDNPPGKYRWSRESVSFQPLPVSQQKQVPSAPDLERAFDALCEAISGTLKGLPAIVAEWRSWYAQTLDQRKKD